MTETIEPQQRTEKTFYSVLRPEPIVLFFLLLAMWLGARGLDADAIWNDEYYSIFDSGGGDFGPRTPAEIWVRVGERNPWHAPGFFIALSGWERLVGSEPPALRAFALLIGLLALAWTYRLGRDLVSPQVGLYAVAVLSTSAFFVHYMHELRMYTLFAMWTAFTIWVYLRIMTRQREPSRWLWLGLLVGAAGMLYTHYFAALPLAAVGVYHLTLLLPLTPRPPLPHKWGEGEKNWRRWWKVVGVLALAGVLFLPWVQTLLAGLERAAKAEWVHIRALSTPDALERLAYLYGNGFPALFVITLVIALFALRNRARGARTVWLLAVAALLAILIVNVILLIMHSGRLRYLMSLAPLIALLVGLALAELSRLPSLGGRVLPLVGLAFWLASGVWSSTRIDFANLDGSQYIYPLHWLAREIKPLAQPEDGVISFLPDDLPEWIHQDPAKFYLRGVPVQNRIIETTGDLEKRDQDRQIMLDFSANRARVWVAYMPDHEPVTVAQFMTPLSESMFRCDAPLERGGLRIEQFTRAEVCCIHDDTPTQALTRLSNGIALVGFSPLPAAVTDHLEATVSWWIPPEVPPSTYSVGLHVLDANANLVAQADYGLAAQTFDCRTTDIPLATLKPGEYRLTAIVYAWETGTRLGDPMLLGTFNVSHDE